MNGLPLHFANPELANLLWAWLALTLLFAFFERRGSGETVQRPAPLCSTPSVPSLQESKFWPPMPGVKVDAIASASLPVSMWMPSPPDPASPQESDGQNELSP